MIADVVRPEIRLTSYYRPVTLINKRCGPLEKAILIERFWSIALADGSIDMYEEQLVRKLAGLLYVAHSDFILARRRAERGATAARAASGG